MQISAVIITKNESRNIERCIKSLIEIVDEIIIVDSMSTDSTKAICTAYDMVTFIEKEWMGYAQTKNFANAQARYEYILSIDADEEVSRELKQSILANKHLGLVGTYSCNRLTNYCGKWIRHMGWYPDTKLRLFPKSGTSWIGEYVHETLSFKRALPDQLLVGDLLHFSYYTTEEHRARADKYSILSAEKMYNEGKKSSNMKSILSGVIRFLAMYIVRGGWLDGYYGYVISKISAQSNYLKYQELNRLNQSK